MSLNTPPSHTRRQFLTKSKYVAPVLLTLPAAPAFAQTGSPTGGSNGDPNGPVNCLAQYDAFLAANNFPSLAQINAAASGGQLPPQHQAAVDALLVAFPENGVCGLS